MNSIHGVLFRVDVLSNKTNRGKRLKHEAIICANLYAWHIKISSLFITIRRQMKTPQKFGTKGSLKWIQKLINKFPEILNQRIISQSGLKRADIIWLSPLKDDGYAEYRDTDFLKVLGLEQYRDQLKQFWPQMGPQWDALGKAGENGPCFLVEAKANIPEIISSSQAKSETSIALIRKSLSETQIFLNCSIPLNWETGFYQYANRMAHLYFLRHSCKVDAYLLFVYFLNDTSHIPTAKEQWLCALELQKRLMGLTKHHLKKYVLEIYIDVNGIDK